MATRERLRPGMLLVLCALALVVCAPPAQAPAPAAPAPAAIASGPAAPPQPTEPPRPLLRVAYVSPVAVMFPLWMAQESGAFEREGVPVEVRYIQANAAVPALLAGEVDLLEISGPAVLTAALGGADLVFVAGALNKMIFSIHAPPDVRSTADLRGKIVGSDRPGTPIAYGTEVALARLGLQPSDVQIRAIGGSDQLLAALLSGQLAAATVAPPMNFTADDAGYPKLVDLYDVPY